MKTRIKGGTMIIDLKDWKLLRSMGVTVGVSKGYAKFRLKGKNCSVARTIMNTPDGMTVDHIHHVKLDNRRSQLRNIPHQQNCWNKGCSSRNTSGYPGVRQTPNGQWYANLREGEDERTLWSCTYPSFDEAVIGRRGAELLFHGEFRYKKISLRVWKAIKKGSRKSP